MEEIKTLIKRRKDELKELLFPEIENPKIIFLNKEPKSAHAMLSDYGKKLITVYIKNVEETEDFVTKFLIHELSHFVFWKICKDKGLLSFADFPYVYANSEAFSFKGDLKGLFSYIDELGAEFVAMTRCRNKINYIDNVEGNYTALVSQNEGVKKRLEVKLRGELKHYPYVNNETLNLFKEAQKTIKFLDGLFKKFKAGNVDETQFFSK